MKVLHINRNYLTTALHQVMIRHLDRSGIESRVIAPTYDTHKTVIVPDENVSVLECFRKTDKPFYFRKQRKITRAVEEAVDVGAFDCIHAYTLFTNGNVARALAEKYHKPFVAAVRNSDVNAFFKYMLHLRSQGMAVLESAGAVFFLSPTYRDTVLTKYVREARRDAIRAKSYVIPNGIDDYWLQNPPESKRPEDLRAIAQKHIRIVSVGEIKKNKNIPTTQKALDILRARGWTVDFSVIGRIEDKREYERIVKNGQTTYYPPKTKEELRAFYTACDILVMPSHTETFGLVYAEAISQGLPVIYTRGQGFDRQFEEGEVGYSVGDTAPEEIAGAIERIAGEYADMRARCVRAAKKFSWDDICAQYEWIYRQVVKNYKK